MDGIEGEGDQKINLYGDRYEGMGGSSKPNNKNSNLNTLQEPVIDTIVIPTYIFIENICATLLLVVQKRDLSVILNKVIFVFSLKGDDNELDQLRRNWDLWGPLVISLIIASSVTLSISDNSRQELFTNLFVVLWLGPFVISLNSILLGAKIALIQSVCLVIYCTSPIVVLSIAVLFLNLTIRSFIVNLILSGVALFFTVRGTKGYFKTLVDSEKRMLILYPVVLFYVFLVTYISMAS